MKLSRGEYSIIIEALNCLKENVQFGGETPPTIEIDNKKVKISEKMIDETIEAVDSDDEYSDEPASLIDTEDLPI